MAAPAKTKKASAKDSQNKKPKPTSGTPDFTETTTTTTTTSPASTITLIEYGTGRPDKASYDKEQEKIKAEIDALQVKAVCVLFVLNLNSCFRLEFHFRAHMQCPVRRLRSSVTSAVDVRRPRERVQHFLDVFRGVSITAHPLDVLRSIPHFTPPLSPSVDLLSIFLCFSSLPPLSWSLDRLSIPLRSQIAHSSSPSSRTWSCAERRQEKYQLSQGRLGRQQEVGAPGGAQRNPQPTVGEQA